ncbi:MAG: hypothetical protein M0Z41_03105 [Peptococcaceae bacterium]|nr:hypothetical protein [Peptococcaceae bacterium]
MAKCTVTVVDTASIQEYIFASNNLKQNVGASELVRLATSDWVFEILSGMGGTNMLRVQSAIGLCGWRFQEDLAIENEESALVSEVVYASAGNAVIIFRTRDDALGFARRLTRRVLLSAPGLQLVVAHEDFDWCSDALAVKIGEVTGRLTEKKSDRKLSMPLLGLGVTADCQFTGLPAVGRDDDVGRYSAQVRAKKESAESGNSRLRQLLRLDGYDITDVFDELGRTRGESSYIAVVHTDGNGIGNRIMALREKYCRSCDNRSYIKVMRAFASSLEDAARKSLQELCARLVDSIVVKNGKKSIDGLVELHGNYILPFRPIVFGGDDTTFVCDGRLGLALAACYLTSLAGKDLADGKRLWARAGIAVVKSHYPFAQAYILAEELTASTKKSLQEWEESGFKNEGIAAMDWHFASSGLIRNLAAVRNEDYTVQNGRLTMRPVRLGQPTAADWRAWDQFKSTWRCIKEDWAGRRNKVKELQEVLRKGPKAVQYFRQAYGLPRLPTVPSDPESGQTGWSGRRCCCFDAIEAMDFFVPMKEADDEKAVSDN